MVRRDRMRGLMLLLLLHACCGFTSLGQPAVVVRRCSAPPRMLKEFDPFSAQRGPPPDRGGEAPEVQEERSLFGREGVPSPEPEMPEETVEPVTPDDLDAANGARILGAFVGGLTGNNLWSGLSRTGLITCSPFNLEGCAAATSRQQPLVPPPAVSRDVGDDFPFAAILRNPTSILPQEWKLEGRRYLEDTEPSATSLQPPPPPPPQQLPEEVSLPFAAKQSGAPSSELSLPEAVQPTDELARLQEEIARLQGQLQLTSSSTDAPMARAEISFSAPFSVLPASASEASTSLPDLALNTPIRSAGSAALDSANLVPNALASGDDDVWLLQASTSVSAFSSTLAESGGSPFDLPALLVTLLSAAIGAVTFEYIALNEEPPVPDPLFSGLYSTLHGAVRTVSKLTGAVAKQLIARLPQP